jgi:L-fuconolactonase
VAAVRIDAHQHYWKIARGDYGWITPELPLYRDFLPEHLRPDLERAGIAGTIAVQAAPTIEESEFLLSLCGACDDVLGVVGWVDIAAPDALSQYGRLAKLGKLVGLRVMIQDMDDPHRALDATCIRNLSAFAARKTPVDLLVTSSQLPVVVELLELVPGLHAVLDHLGKPPIAADALEPWATNVRTIARHANVFCKLSGMVTEARSPGWQMGDFVAYVGVVLDAFGMDRVMFGSDWPVCLTAASYEQVCEVLVHALVTHGWDAADERVWGSNASLFYGV